MAFEKLLDHKCDIYHLVKTEKSPGYGLPSSPSFNYSDEPDESGISCHFGVESLDTEVSQKQPQNILREKIKLTLPINTDIRINDKVVDYSTGYEYTAEKPRNIRGHHIFVYVKRTKSQEAL